MPARAKSTDDQRSSAWLLVKQIDHQWSNARMGGHKGGAAGSPWVQCVRSCSVRVRAVGCDYMHWLARGGGGVGPQAANARQAVSAWASLHWSSSSRRRCRCRCRCRAAAVCAPHHLFMGADMRLNGGVRYPALGGGCCSGGGGGGGSRALLRRSGTVDRELPCSFLLTKASLTQIECSG